MQKDVPGQKYYNFQRYSRIQVVKFVFYVIIPEHISEGGNKMYGNNFTSR